MSLVHPVSRPSFVVLVGVLCVALAACGEAKIEDVNDLLDKDVSVDLDAATDAKSTGDAVEADTGPATDTAVGADVSDDATDGSVTADTGPADAGGPACSTKSDCPAATPWCVLPAGVCQACKYAAHCPGEHARCVAGSCVAPLACAGDKDCAAADGVCDPGTKFCADCVNHDDCGAGKVCKLGQCLPKPVDCKSSKDCADLKQVCTGNNICEDCATHADCPQAEYCNGGLCLPAACTPATAVCTGPITRKVCKGDGSGYTEDQCASQQGCEDGVCKKQICNPGKTQCDGDKPSTCNAAGLKWESGAACKAGEFCSGGKCTAKVCNKGDVKCDSAGKLETCADDEKSWVSTACPAGQSCKDKKCVAQICTPKSTFCDGEKVMSCGALGLSTSLVKDCAGAQTICAEGACAPPTCKSGDVLCKGDAEAVCKADGSGWEVKACTDLDKNKCTVEACDAKVHKCVSGPTNPCDDKNPCTAGSCNGFTGACSQAPKAGACDDGDACTSGDVCANGKCLNGPGVVSLTVGKSGAGFADGPGDVARVNQPYAAALDADGSVVFGDTGNRRVRRLHPDGSVSTVAGDGNYGDTDGPADVARFRSPRGVAVGRAGWIFVADREGHRLRAISGGGVVSTVAGNGAAADKDGKADVAQFYSPDSIAVGADGALWVGESSRHRVRMVSAAGEVTTPFGTGAAGFVDGPAATAKIHTPSGLALGPKGLVWFSDTGNKRVRAYDPAKKTVTTKIGTGTSGYVDGPAAKAALTSPTALHIDASGRVWFYDTGNFLIRRLGLDGSVVTVAGQQGKSGFADGVAAKATFADVRGLTVDAKGGVVVVSRNGNRLRRMASTVVTCDDGSGCTVDSCDPGKGTCTFKLGKTGDACDDGTACTTADACDAKGACVGKAKSCSDGNVCTVDDCNPYTAACAHTEASLTCEDGDKCTPGDVCVQGTCKSDVGRVETLLGVGATSLLGKDAPGPLQQPTGLARDSKGTLYLAERGKHRLRSVTTAGVSSVFAGEGTAGFIDGPAAKARFNAPTGIAVDPFGTVYVADSNNHRVRKVNPQGVVTTLAGSGGTGFKDGKGTAAQFNLPWGIDVGSKGDVYVADRNNHRVRRIATDGTVTTLAGDGTAGFLDGKGKFVRCNSPRDVLALPDGSVLFSDYGNHRLRRITADGTVATWAGTGSTSRTEGARLSTHLGYPSGLGRAADGTVWLTSEAVHEIRRVGPDGQVTRVSFAGAGFLDGPANAARFNAPLGVVGVSGTEAWVADVNNGRVRRVIGAKVACVEGTACAPNLCDAKTGACAAKPIADGGGCTPGLCKKGGTCKSGACEGGVADTCDDKNGCTVDSCDAKTGSCVHVVNATQAGCCVADVLTEGFEKGLASWTADPPSKDVAWRVWTPKATDVPKAGKSVLKMGLPNEEKLPKLGSYTYSYVTGPEIAIPAGVDTTLSLQVRFDLTKTSLHRLYVYVQLDNGAQLSLGTITQSNTTWNPWTTSLVGFGGRKIRVRLRGRIYGNSSVGGQGILVDEVKVASSCKPKTCTSVGQCPSNLSCNKGACVKGVCAYTDTCCSSAAQCDDNKPCTADTCHYSVGCQHSTIGGCCNTAKDDAAKLCNDNNPCTADVCPASGGPCLHNAIATCCLSDVDCDDGKGCTVDTCNAKNTCDHKDICCTGDKDCEDGDDKCTTDKCVSGKCQWTYKNVVGCCQAVLGPWHFNDSKQQTGWTFQTCTPSTSNYVPASCKPVTPGANHKGWQVAVVALQSKSPQGALYYGDPAAKNFAFGASAQTALSPKMTVQPGTSTLKFNVYWDTEGGTTYDKLQAFLWVDGKRVTTGNKAPAAGAAWYKGQSGHTSPKKWAEVAVNVSAYKGKSVQVELYMNTGDGAGNSGQGVFVDDLRIESTCK